MAHETVRLAEYAAALRYQDLPAEVVQRAKECIADTVAAIICGSALPWSRIVIRYAERTGRPANVGVIGVALFRERQPQRVYAPQTDSAREAPSAAGALAGVAVGADGTDDEALRDADGTAAIVEDPSPPMA